MCTEKCISSTMTVWALKSRVGRGGYKVILNIYLLEEFLEVKLSRLTKYSVEIWNSMGVDIVLVGSNTSLTVVVNNFWRLQIFQVKYSSGILIDCTKVSFRLEKFNTLWNSRCKVSNHFTPVIVQIQLAKDIIFF